MRNGAVLIFVFAAVAVTIALLVRNGDGMIAGLRPDDFARGSYLAILAVVLLLGMLATFRTNLSGALKATVFWALGFIVLIGLYAYRDEFREVGDRMLAEVVPGHVIEVANSDGRQFMVRRADDQHFHVEATVDGVPVTFLVDTGASMVAIDRRTAGRLGFDLAELAFTDLVETASGTTRSASITLASLRIGAIERRNVKAAVMEADGIGINLLGMTFLGTLSSFDFQGPRLVLTN